MGDVVDHLADGAVAAHVRHATRVGAFVVDARLIHRALSVVPAADLTDAIETDVAAIAEGVAVANRAANSVDAARVRQAFLVTM